LGACADPPKAKPLEAGAGDFLKAVGAGAEPPKLKLPVADAETEGALSLPPPKLNEGADLLASPPDEGGAAGPDPPKLNPPAAGAGATGACVPPKLTPPPAFLSPLETATGGAGVELKLKPVPPEAAGAGVEPNENPPLAAGLGAPPPKLNAIVTGCYCVLLLFYKPLGFIMMMMFGCLL
jgi:hypothetical protein